MDISVSMEDLKTDLYYLRKDRGFVSSRIYTADTFLTVMDARKEPFEDIENRFIWEIRSLKDRQNSEALLAAYGLLPGYRDIPSIKERREEYGALVGRKYDTLSDRENAAIDELAIRLMTRYYISTPLSETPAVPYGVALMPRLSILTTIYNRNGFKHHKTYQIISLVDGVNCINYRSNHESIITPIEGITVETKHSKGVSFHRFFFSKVLKRGESYMFKFWQEPACADVEKDVWFNSVGNPFSIPTLVYEQRVDFQDDVPPMIWSFRNTSFIGGPGEPNRKNILQADANGIVQKEFYRLYGGLYSGIAWEWK